LKESEEKHFSIFNRALDGMLLIDLENKKFFLANEMICRMLGYSLAEIKSLGVTDIHPEEFIPNILQAFESHLRGESALARDIPVRRKDGSIFLQTFTPRQLN
jgi:PAS domain S-box-containing protein